MLANLLSTTCEKYSGNTALVFSEEKYTFHELNQLTQRLASSFLQLNIREGDKIAFFLTNCPEAVLCFTACFKMGAIVVPINQFFKHTQLTYIFNIIQPKILITETKLLPEVLKTSNEVLAMMDCYLIDKHDQVQPKMKSFKNLIENNHIETFPAVNEDVIATISFTSGSSGIPKGVLHSQKQLYYFLLDHAKIVRYIPEDTILACIPIAFGYCFSNQVLPSLYSGSTLSLIPSGDFERVVDAIISQPITVAYVGPTTLIQVLNTLKNHSEFTHRLRAIFSAGDALPPALHKQVKELFGVAINEGIGMTETWLYALNPLDESMRLGSMGKPCGNNQIKIMDENKRSLLAGQIGEIVIKGPTVMLGYYPGNRKTSHENWFNTGDLGFMDKEGYVYYCGRRELSTIKNDVVIFPHEIEFVLYEHPAVFQAGVSCAEKIIAFVALRPEIHINKEELFIHLTKYLSPEKIPDDIIFLPQIPKGITGKIDRRLLKSLITV